MSDAMTCGKGLAARSPLPEKLAELTAAMAEILAFHQRSLQLNDPDAMPELRVYARLEEQYRTVATLLHTIADTMRGARDLPMPAHDTTLLGSEQNRAIFATFMQREGELVALLKDSLKKDQLVSP